jgi:hypothetical protein
MIFSFYSFKILVKLRIWYCILKFDNSCKITDIKLHIILVKLPIWYCILKFHNSCKIIDMILHIIISYFLNDFAYCKIIIIRGARTFVVFVGRSIHEFKIRRNFIPTNTSNHVSSLYMRRRFSVDYCVMMVYR